MRHRMAWVGLVALVHFACGPEADVAPQSSGGGAGTSASGTAGDGVGAAGLGGGPGAAGSGSAGSAAGPEHVLLGAPLVFAPTTQGFGLSVIVSAGDPSTLSLRVQAEGTSEWSELAYPELPGADVAEWTLAGLAPGTRYTYEVLESPPGSAAALFAGSVVTEREPGASFSFALVSDTHIGSDLEYSNQGDELTLASVSNEIRASGADFVVNLGDILDFHEFGFNTPPPDGSITRAAYLNYRATYAQNLGNLAHFSVLGGWDSENGCNTVEEVERSRVERLRYLPGPRPETYPEGGSPFEDYYAFTWGDALFVTLNVYGYTPGCHLLDSYPGVVEDWTLGDAQLQWLRTTLQNSTAKWRFLMIHHPVGGDAGNSVNTAYGRGGGRAAHVGEQEIVHELMQEYGVQAMFYGHDHVFTDMVVDDIHYSLPGSAGAIWYFTEAETGYTEFWPSSGWARVDVTPDDVHVQFLAVGGTLLYEYTLK